MIVRLCANNGTVLSEWTDITSVEDFDTQDLVDALEEYTDSSDGGWDDDIDDDDLDNDD